MGSYPQYNNANRDYNARQFVQAWNNTIIPPDSKSFGTEIMNFTMSADPETPGDGVSHGVCPLARTLRSISLAMALPYHQA